MMKFRNFHETSILANFLFLNYLRSFDFTNECSCSIYGLLGLFNRTLNMRGIKFPNLRKISFNEHF